MFQAFATSIESQDELLLSTLSEISRPPQALLALFRSPFEERIEEEVNTPFTPTNRPPWHLAMRRSLQGRQSGGAALVIHAFRRLLGHSN